VDILGTVPPWIRADGKRLRQILINLLSNALRFTPVGEVTLRLDFRRHVCRIDVVDTGIGIAPQDQQRVFLPFERGSAGRRVSEAGTGLGLTITHLLTELMGGQLSLQSTPGRGSTFSVHLYLPEVTMDPTRPLSRSPALRPAVGYLAPRRTLLVVDDQPLQRQLLAALLVPLGFEVLEAASGRECLEIVEQKPPDAVLLDITMDDLDGWQTAALLREGLSAQALPIVFVSANLFDHRPDRIEALQCQGFVAKPVLESELLDALERSLQLEWVRANTPLAPLHPAPAAGEVVAALPEPLREELRRLVSQGNGSALRRRLRAARDELPGGTATLDLLQACADRFDFAALAGHLREDEHAARA
jgi:CheY-like chemotaxis protein